MRGLNSLLARHIAYALFWMGDDPVQHRLQRLVGLLGNFDELRRPVNAAPVHAVQHHAVQMCFQVSSRAKAMNRRGRTAVRLVGLEPGLTE